MVFKIHCKLLYHGISSIFHIKKLSEKVHTSWTLVNLWNANHWNSFSKVTEYCCLTQLWRILIHVSPIFCDLYWKRLRFRQFTKLVSFHFPYIGEFADDRFCNKIHLKGLLLLFHCEASGHYRASHRGVFRVHLQWGVTSRLELTENDQIEPFKCILLYNLPSANSSVWGNSEIGCQYLRCHHDLLQYITKIK